MKTFPDNRIRAIHELVHRANSAGRSGDHVAAAELFRQAAARCDAYGLQSAWLRWALAAALDNQGETEMALIEIQAALQLDPGSPDTHRSFGIIARRLQRELHELEVSDPNVPRVYGLLRDAGALDVDAHLFMARHHAAVGQVAEARALVEALCLLAPSSREVWLERARLARQAGELAAAAEFEAEAQARNHPDIPFAIPAPPKEES